VTSSKPHFPSQISSPNIPLNFLSDAGALLLTLTLPHTNLLAINVNHPSSYSALAVSAILSHYNQPSIPIGIRRPLTNESFFDSWSYELGEFTSKVAYHWSNETIPWGKLEEMWDPVRLYRKVLAGQEDGSVVIASLGFFENVSKVEMCFLKLR